MIRASICLATYHKPRELRRVLASIRRQRVPFEYEIVVADDDPGSDRTADFCREFDAIYLVSMRYAGRGYRNPATARNVAYRMARGEIIIAQSDEVLHYDPDTIVRLCEELRQGEFLIAQTWNAGPRPGIAFPDELDGNFDAQFSLYWEMAGPTNQRPFFFLGSLWRKDLYAVGGNDEDFQEPGYDDNWFADCLTRGLGLKARYTTEVLGLHQDHPRPDDLAQRVARAYELYQRKVAAGVWQARGGPWDITKAPA